MTTQQPAPVPAPPTPPSPPGTPSATPPSTPVSELSTASVPPPPSNAQELAALKQRRTEYSNQLQSATSRREQLARELRNPMVEGADRAGLEQRLRLLDQRILRLEIDIAISGQQLANAPGRLVATARVSESFGGLPAGGVIGLGALTIVGVLAPLAFAAARLMLRRARHPAPAPAIAPAWDGSPRLERLESAVDAIAIEVERVAEGQRFVSRLLAESHGAAAYAVGASHGASHAPRGSDGAAGA